MTSSYTADRVGSGNAAAALPNTAPLPAMPRQDRHAGVHGGRLRAGAHPGAAPVPARAQRRPVPRDYLPQLQDLSGALRAAVPRVWLLDA